LWPGVAVTCTLRLEVRTLAFQADNAGSIPAGCTGRAVYGLVGHRRLGSTADPTSRIRPGVKPLPSHGSNAGSNPASCTGSLGDVRASLRLAGAWPSHGNEGPLGWRVSYRSPLAPLAQRQRLLPQKQFSAGSNPARGTVPPWRNWQRKRLLISGLWVRFLPGVPVKGLGSGPGCCKQCYGCRGCCCTHTEFKCPHHSRTSRLLNLHGLGGEGESTIPDGYRQIIERRRRGGWRHTTN
jgi:hypothetical protein